MVPCVSIQSVEIEMPEHPCGDVNGSLSFDEWSKSALLGMVILSDDAVEKSRSFSIFELLKKKKKKNESI